MQTQFLLFFGGLTLMRQKIIIKYKDLYLNPYLSSKDSAFAKNGIILKIIFILLSRLGLPIRSLV